VDVRDVADAFAAALACPDPGHVRLLLCADDIADDHATFQVTREHIPDVPWREGEPPADSFRALVDTGLARSVLGWRPKYSWRRFRSGPRKTSPSAGRKLFR
jgi:nucleoside-diphosphate-sugar epimerase